MASIIFEFFSSILSKNWKKIFFTHYILDIYNRKIYEDYYVCIENSISNILKCSDEKFYSTASLELDKIQQLKLRANINIKETSLLKLLDKIIKIIANLISFQIIILNEKYKSAELDYAVKGKIKKLKELNELKYDLENVFRSLSVSESLLLKYIKKIIPNK